LSEAVLALDRGFAADSALRMQPATFGIAFRDFTLRKVRMQKAIEDE
jgi:hypothetical protein